MNAFDKFIFYYFNIYFDIISLLLPRLHEICKFYYLCHKLHPSHPSLLTVLIMFSTQHDLWTPHWSIHYCPYYHSTLYNMRCWLRRQINDRNLSVLMLHLLRSSGWIWYDFKDFQFFERLWNVIWRVVTNIPKEYSAWIITTNFVAHKLKCFL
jgi:hypothetical protein